MENVNQLRVMWFEPPHKRLATWRDFRKSLTGKTVEEIAEQVCQWWATAPIGPRNVDPYDATTWPDAWEMLHEGQFCKSTVAIGMSYTIFYIDKNIENKLIRIQDLDNRDIYITALIDNKFLLNYNYGEVVEWSKVQDTIKIQETWDCHQVVQTTKYHEKL